MFDSEFGWFTPVLQTLQKRALLFSCHSLLKSPTTCHHFNQLPGGSMCSAVLFHVPAYKKNYYRLHTLNLASALIEVFTFIWRWTEIWGWTISPSITVLPFGQNRSITEGLFSLLFTKSYTRRILYNIVYIHKTIPTVVSWKLWEQLFSQLFPRLFSP